MSASKPLLSTHSLEHPRARILRAARDVFLSNGFSRSNMDMVAASAGMSKQSIYELFPGKAALFEVSVRDTFVAYGKNVAVVAGPSDDYKSALWRLARRFSDGLTEDVSLGMFRASIVAANNFPDLAADIHAQRVAILRRCADYIESLILCGEIAAFDPFHLAVRFGGLAVEGSRYFLDAQLPSPQERDGVATAAVDLFLNGYHGQVEQPGIVYGGDDPAQDLIEPPTLKGAGRLSPERLQYLVDVAIDEFLANGYHGASINRIVDAVRMSKSTIYRHFGDKEGLFRYVIRCRIYEASRAEFAIRSYGKNVDAAVAALARRALDWQLTPSSIHMQRLMIQEADFVPDLARQFYDVRVRQLGHALKAVLAKYDQPVPNAAALRAFYALATFSLRYLTATEFPDDAQRDAHSAECARLFLYGVVARQE